MLGQGHTLRLLDAAWDVGRHQHPGPENQDSQHMIDQPRGFFLPENCEATNLGHNRPTHFKELPPTTYDAL